MKSSTTEACSSGMCALEEDETTPISKYQQDCPCEASFYNLCVPCLPGGDVMGKMNQSFSPQLNSQRVRYPGPFHLLL